MAVIESEGRVLLVRRPAKGRLGGMWAFPAVVRLPEESIPAGAERAAREGLGMEVRAGETFASVRHTFTHVRATYHAVHCEPNMGEPAPVPTNAES